MQLKQGTWLLLQMSNNVLRNHEIIEIIQITPFRWLAQKVIHKKNIFIINHYDYSCRYLNESHGVFCAMYKLTVIINRHLNVYSLVPITNNYNILDKIYFSLPLPCSPLIHFIGHIFKFLNDPMSNPEVTTNLKPGTTRSRRQPNYH